MIMTAAATNGSGPSAKRAGIGTLIGVYALIDLPVGIAIMLLAWWGRALLVWAVAAALLFIINIAACGWIQREWDRWMSGSRAARFEARLQKWREGRLRRVVNGVTGVRSAGSSSPRLSPMRSSLSRWLAWSVASRCPGGRFSSLWWHSRSCSRGCGLSLAGC
jgi:hypothetical protein